MGVRTRRRTCVRQSSISQIEKQKWNFSQRENSYKELLYRIDKRRTLFQFCFSVSPACKVRKRRFMKLGNIKLQSLSLISPDLSVECDEDKLSDALYALRLNPSCAPYLIASVGAINRAFAQIEGRLLSGVGVILLELSSENFQNSAISLDNFNDILKISQVKINGVSVGFGAMDTGKIKVDYHASYGRCEITYFKKIKRINLLTGALYDIDLGGIEEFIPYYVKHELVSSESYEEAEKAMEIFENALKEYENAVADGGFVDTVYSLRRI